MKYFLSLIAVGLIAILGFSFLPKSAGASKVQFGSGDLKDESEIAKQISIGVLKGRMLERGIANTEDFSVRKIRIDETGMAHTRFRQTVSEIPVWGGEAIVHLNKDGSVFALTDSLVDGLAVNKTTELSKVDAVNIAKNEYGDSRNLTAITNVDLWIYRGETRDHLAYRVQMERFDESKNTGMPVYFIDAQSGEVVFKYDDFQTASGLSQYSGTVTFDTSVKTGTYYLEDLTRKIGTFNYNNGSSTKARFTDSDNNWNNGGAQTAGVDAHWGATQVYNYYQTTFGRNAIDGNGGPLVQASFVNKRTKLITSGVHYGFNYVNAGWTGNQMIYGDGNGTLSSALTTLDICGHEFTHGVTQYEANLVYSGQSGALNEATSDIFGAMIERYAKGLSANTWKIGEECWTPATSGDALRYMDNPHLASNSGYTADDDPDHYTERYTGTGDNGGVHINSGIPNNAFYLMAMGGTHHIGGTMSASIGPDKAAAIWYRALRDFMTTSTNFAGARTATISAANALYPGGPEAAIVAEAWTKVGV